MIPYRVFSGFNMFYLRRKGVVGLFMGMGLTALMFPAKAAVWSFVPQETLLSSLDEMEFRNVYLPISGSIQLSPSAESLGALEDAMIWSIAVDRGENLYLGTGNKNTIYRYNLRTKKLQPVFTHHNEGEVFALLFMDNTLYFGTSPQGTLYRLLPSGQAESLVNTGEGYIHGLVPGLGNSIICATGPNGRLFRIYPDRRMELIFSAPAAHITALHWLKPGRELLIGASPGGTVYRLEFSSTGVRDRVSVLYDTPLEEVRQIISSGSSIYLAANPGSEPGPGGHSTGNQPVVYALSPEGFVQWQWQCPESTIFSLVHFRGQTLVFTGNRGMVYALDSMGIPAVFARLDEPQVISTAVQTRTVYVGTANPARLYRFTDGYADSGYVHSPVFDCQTPSKFGRLDFRARVPNGTEIQFETRSGNSERPDSLWSFWEPFRDRIPSPPGRFVQWRAKLYSRFRQLTPELDRVDLYYQPANRAPVITRLEISAPSETAARKGNFQPKRQINFEVQDPDDDSLVYQLLLKGESGTGWLTIEKEFTESRYELDTRTLPDGWYRLCLVASDVASRGPGGGLRTERLTAPFLVDNTPPEVGELKLTGNRVSWTVADKTSPIVACRISLNTGNWQPVEPQDGVFDELQERFVFLVELKPGINTIAVWATDALGNTTTRQIILGR